MDCLKPCTSFFLKGKIGIELTGRERVNCRYPERNKEYARAGSSGVERAECE
jgi:hypothetical protein